MKPIDKLLVYKLATCTLPFGINDSNNEWVLKEANFHLIDMRNIHNETFYCVPFDNFHEYFEPKKLEIAHSPECICDIKKLFSVGHESDCSYLLSKPKVC